MTAFVLAGGKSSRMGQDKAFLELHGKLLIDHAIEQAKIADEVFIVGPKAMFSAFGRIVEDRYPEAGPLGGIHAALAHSRTELNLVLGVDMPFVTAGFLEYLCETARKNTALVTVPRQKERLQPLCAVYRKNFVETAETALKAGNHKVDALFATVQTSFVDLKQEPVVSMGLPPEMFDNINSPQDYERAKGVSAPKSKWKQARQS